MSTPSGREPEKTAPQDVPFSVTLTWPQWLAVSHYVGQHAANCIPGEPDPDALAGVKIIDAACNAFEDALYKNAGISR